MSDRIIFYCGVSPEAWAPPKIDGSGVGGSETAVIEIARRFCADGWRVDVYGNPEQWEGEHDGVGYWDLKRLEADESADVLVAWRQPRAFDLPIKRRASLCWVHDHNHGPDAAPTLAPWDRVLAVSPYHRDFLAAAYGLTNADYVPNGIDLARFDPTVRKVPFRCVYASSPDRGLSTLLDLWPAIRGDERSAELHVAYGFDTMMKIDARWGAFRDEMMARMEAMKPQGVVYRGRLPQNELATLYAESVMWPYPSDFLETSCISAMEAMAGGCVPVTSSCGALKDTVGGGGLVVWGPRGTRSNPYSPAWQEFFVNCARSVLYERNVRLIAEAKARAWAQRYSWDASYQRWRSVVDAVLNPAQMIEQEAAG